MKEEPCPLDEELDAIHEELESGGFAYTSGFHAGYDECLKDLISKMDLYWLIDSPPKTIDVKVIVVDFENNGTSHLILCYFDGCVWCPLNDFSPLGCNGIDFKKNKYKWSYIHF